MTGTRKNHSPKFKAEAALALLRDDAPLSELSAKYCNAGSARLWRRCSWVFPQRRSKSKRPTSLSD